MRTSTLALTSLEIAVRCRGAALTRLQDVRVHPETHRAARVAPIEASVFKDFVEPFLLGLGLHTHRAGNHQSPGALLDLVAFEDGGGGAQVLDASVRARAEEDGVNLYLPDRSSRRERHVLESALVAVVFGLGDGLVEPDCLGRGRPPGDVW